MRNIITLVLLGVALWLGIAAASDGVFDGRSALAFLLVAIALVIQYSKGSTRR